MHLKTTSSLLLFTFILFTSIKAQQSESDIDDFGCGTEITAEQLEYLESTARQRTLYTFDKSNKSTTFIPVQTHIVRRSNGTGGLNASELSNIMKTINHYYSEIDLYFYECGPVNFIDDDTYYDFNSSSEGAIAAANDVTNVINIYYFNTVRSGSSAVCGYSRFPPSPDRVIMANSCALNGSTIVHELGHYFSLFHTHGKTNTGTTDEFVNGSNCTTAGDNICDTPADPNLSGRVSTSCSYTGTVLDPNGQSYSPQTDNIMSYSRKECRRLITQGQYNRVAFSVQFERNYLFCNAPAPTADFSVNTIESCRGKVLFEDNSTSLPSSWLWDFGDGTTSTLRNPAHTYDSNGTYTVTLTTTNSNGSDTEVKSNFITINLPSKPLMNQADSVCINDSALLSGSGNGNLLWYTSDTSTLPIGNGLFFQTGAIVSDTVFFVEDRIPNLPVVAGPLDNTFGTGINLNSNRHLIFDAFKPFTLKSVDVYAQGAGMRTFELRNFLGLILQDTTINLVSGKQTVDLNFNVPAEQDLQLGLSVTSAIDLYRNNSNINYPYTSPGLLSIKNSSAGSGFYYFFYNWQVIEADCISAREAVKVNLKNCAVGIEPLKASDFKLYPNPNNGLFVIEFFNALKNGTVSVYGVTGNKVLQKSVNSAKLSIDMSNQPKGMYYVNINSGGFQLVQKIVIH